MDFEEILKELRISLSNLVQNQFGEFKKDGQAMVNAFLEDSKGKLKKWTTLLTNKEIDLEEYEWLLQSQKDLFVINTLYNAGVSKIKLDRFKDKAINTIVDVVAKLILL